MKEFKDFAACTCDAHCKEHASYKCTSNLPHLIMKNWRYFSLIETLAICCFFFRVETYNFL